METALVADWGADEATCVETGVGTGVGTGVESCVETGVEMSMETDLVGKSSCTLYSAPWGIFHKLKSASGRTISICWGSSWEAKEKSAHIIISESSGEGL